MIIEIKRQIHTQYVQAHKKSNYKHKESKEEIYIYIYENDYYNSKRGGMSLSIKKLTHPYSLTHKDYNKEKG